MKSGNTKKTSNHALSDERQTAWLVGKNRMYPVMGVNMSENADVKLLFEYFKEMRSEINVRIKNHTSLLTAKVVTSGGLLAFMLTEDVKDLPEVKTLGFLVVPLVAFLFDVMIAKNIRNIHTIGLFIRDQIEFGFRQKDILHDKFKMWEEYAGQRNTWTRCYGIVDVKELENA